MALTFKPDDMRRMLQVQEELARVLRAANERKLEAALAAFACARLARNLLEFYPENTRKMLAELLAAHIDKRDVVMESEGLAKFLM